jgi:hypothetical protein
MMPEALTDEQQRAIRACTYWSIAGFGTAHGDL